jgi:hypothetical protein
VGQGNGAAAEEREVHAEDRESGQRRRNDDGESHDRKYVDGAINQQLLTDETERPGETGARQAH